MKNIEKLVKQVISEATKLTIGKHQFILKIDTNEDPNKKGVKVQFIPAQFGGAGLTPNEQSDIAIKLEDKLEKGLAPYELRVERDRNLKDKSIIGFFIYIEYFDKIIRKALTGDSQEQTPPQTPV